MESIAIDSLKPSCDFKGDLLVDSSFMLVPYTADLTESTIKFLKLWGFKQVMCDADILMRNQSTEDISPDKFRKNDDNQTKIAGSVKKALESSKKARLGNSDQARMNMVQSVFDEYMNYIENLFTHYTTHKQINQDELSDTVQELCVFIKDHRRYILRINPDASVCKKNFLVIHTMRSTVLAIAIGMEMHLGLSKIIELGVSCILHEIGMLRLPPQLYMSDKRLTPGEKAQIVKHSIFGYTIVKDLDFPTQIQLGVLEHHEKENGTGYPQKKTGDKISQNAKIISVACSYEAISSQRSYRDERSTFEAIVELIQNKNHAYDDGVIKALLFTVSLYPIGSYVYLSNRKVAIVIDVNPSDPKSPIVQLLTEKDSLGQNKIITTNQDDLKILRILTKNERNDILNVIAENEKKSKEAGLEAEAAIDSIAHKEDSIKPEEPAEAPQKGSGNEEEVDINSFLL